MVPCLFILKKNEIVVHCDILFIRQKKEVRKHLSTALGIPKVGNILP